HDPSSFKSDDKDPKKTARTMLKMAFDLDTRFFAGRTALTCWTCHRAESQPEAFKPAKKLDWPLPPVAAADADRPAREKYQNLKALGEIPAGRVSEVMIAFSGALGTGCVHCHEPGKWAEDTKPAKQRAREMLGMVREINSTYFDGKFKVQCGTCHRGNV